MESVVRTIYGAYLQTCLLRNSNFKLTNNTTLNQAFGIFPTDVSTTNELPTIKYLSVGNGGHTVTTGSPGFLEVRHTPEHGNLYNTMPLIARPVSSDLSAVDMAKYRLKVTKSINGVPYFFYFLKALPSFKGDPALVNLYTYTDSSAISNYIPTYANLNPTPPANTVIDLNTYSKYVAVMDSIPFVFAYGELQELTTAYQLWFNKTDYPIMSEIGICSGVEVTKVDTNGITYDEAILAQINYFVNTYYAVQAEMTANKEINTFIELGGMEPMLNY